MVIMLSGIPSHPIAPSTITAGSRFGMMAMTARRSERKRTMNISMMARNTMPMVRIWDWNRLCSMLLYSTNMLVKRNWLSAYPRSFTRWSRILSSRAFRSSFLSDSMIRMVNLAWAISSDTYGFTSSSLKSWDIFSSSMEKSNPSRGWSLLSRVVSFSRVARERTSPVSGRLSR